MCTLLHLTIVFALLVVGGTALRCTDLCLGTYLFSRLVKYCCVDYLLDYKVNRFKVTHVPQVRINYYYYYYYYTRGESEGSIIKR